MSGYAFTRIGFTFVAISSLQTENLDDLGEAISEKTSNVTLIDLAGSERADSAETTGERLKVSEFKSSKIVLAVTFFSRICVDFISWLCCL